MRFRIFAATLLLIGVCGVVPVHAQYKEMSKLNGLAEGMPEPQMFEGLAAHFAVSVDVLKQEKSANDLSFGQLYLAHAVAKASKSDVKGILTESKSKTWPEIAKEKNVDMKMLSTDADELEKAIKKLGAK